MCSFPSAAFTRPDARHGADLPVTTTRMAGAMADELQIPLDEQLGEIGAQLDWVRGYL